MTDDDFEGLAVVLQGFGLNLTLIDSDGSDGSAPGEPPLAPPPSSNTSPQRNATLALSDGRRLHIADLSAHAATNAHTQRRDRPPAVSTSTASSDAASDTRFRLLAEHATDLIVAVDADLAILYASPATRTLLGCDPATLSGHTLAELLVPEERAAFIARHFTRAAQRGAGPDLFRALRPDGGTRWVEARVAALPAGNGLGDYLVTLRDAEQRRRAEEQLGRANAELSALAATDALTGLPNRRVFDQTLGKEWYRAQRDAMPLALMMIDVDHFKQLNDQFGHPAGDAFLSLVGQVIRDNVRRAGDLAARYGGEEFAVILPGTSAAGALEIAETIRRAVAAADTRHIVGGGFPITASIGVAATVPMSGGGVTALVHNADSALYLAKRSGRNRVEIMQ